MTRTICPFDDLANQRAAHAFEALFARTHPHLVRVAFKITGDHEEAEDIAQKSFARAHVQILTGGESPGSSWLSATARNAAIDIIRKRNLAGSRFKHVSRELEHSPAELVEREEDARFVRAAIETLPIYYRNALTLRYLLELPYSQIAEQLGIPIGTVKTHISRAKSQLGNRLRKDLTASHVFMKVPDRYDRTRQSIIVTGGLP